MKTKTLIIGLAVVSVLGVLFHFAYDFFKISYLKAVFPSNESIFEHLKLIIFPTLLFIPIDYFLSKNNRINLLSSYISGIIVACVFMISSYYTYSGIIGFDVAWVNIIIFFISVIIIFIYRYKKIALFDGANSAIAFIILLIIIEIFSFYPTNLGIFEEAFLHFN